MQDLLLISFKAQCKWLEPRILDKDKKLDFIQAKILIMNKRFDDISKNEGSELAIDVFLETEKNLTARFETGIPLESSYYEYY